MIGFLVTAAVGKVVSVVVEREVKDLQHEGIEKHKADGYDVGTRVRMIRGRKKGMTGAITLVKHLWFYVKDDADGKVYRVLAENAILEDAPVPVFAKSDEEAKEDGSGS